MMEPVHRLVIDTSSGSALSGVFYTEDSAMEEGSRYLRTNPSDIVMVVELGLAHCRHCEQTIIEKPGWVWHRWIHLYTGAYLCYLKLTQAEPKPEPHYFEPYGAHVFCYWRDCGLPQNDPIHKKEPA